MDNVSAIIVAIGTVLTAVLSYFQYSKNKTTDFKIEQWKTNEKQKNVKRNSNISQIYGVLWRLLHNMHADRVFIIQPHPLVKNLYVSVSLEVHDNGVEEIKSDFQDCKAGDYASLVSNLSQRNFLYYEHTYQIKDNKSRALSARHGANTMFIKKLSDDKCDWIGSIVCEYLHDEKNITVDFGKKVLQQCADEIQYILPEYE